MPSTAGFVCDRCEGNVSFTTQNDLDRHRIFFHNSVCEFCLETFNDNQSLIRSEPFAFFFILVLFPVMMTSNKRKQMVYI